MKYYKCPVTEKVFTSAECTGLGNPPRSPFTGPLNRVVAQEISEKAYQAASKRHEKDG